MELETRGRVPAWEWTDNEWLMVIRDLPPDTPGVVGETYVAVWRRAGEHARAQLAEALDGCGRSTFPEVVRKLWRIP